VGRWPVTNSLPTSGASWCRGMDFSHTRGGVFSVELCRTSAWPAGGRPSGSPLQCHFLDVDNHTYPDVGVSRLRAKIFPQNGHMI
jgi:hypothetical protein